MKNTKKIGWQKYEDYIEKQITSPFLHNIIQNIMSLGHKDEKSDDDESDDDEEDESFDDSSEIKKVSHVFNQPFMPLTNQFIEDISMLTSFDCWMGHTNFDLTPSVRKILDEVPGIEILKICSRYRFFIGIGKMFDFKSVRTDIENAIIGD